MAKKKKISKTIIRRKDTRRFSAATLQYIRNTDLTDEPIVLRAITCYGDSLAHTISLSELDESFNIALKEVRSNGN